MPNKKENKLVLYKDDEGKLSVNTLFADEDVWLTQAQLAEIYKSSKSNISEHLKNIFNDNELDKEVVVRKFRTTTQHGAIEGKTQTHEVLHYILEGSGTVSHQEAIEKAEREFEIYREREMRMLESDFDKAVKALLENNDNQKEG